VASLERSGPTSTQEDGESAKNFGLEPAHTRQGHRGSDRDLASVDCDIGLFGQSRFAQLDGTRAFISAERIFNVCSCAFVADSDNGQTFDCAANDTCSDNKADWAGTLRDLYELPERRISSVYGCRRVQR
jgi:hypothetical protein